MSYYYLSASLPALSLDSAPPLTGDAFRTLCAEQLSPRDLRALNGVLAAADDGPAGHPFASRWRVRDGALRNAIVRVRAAKLRVEAARHLRDDSYDVSAERAVADAYARPNPRDRELALDRFRWAQLDELAGFDPFSINAIMAYGLKLGIAERWSSLNTEQGREHADAIIRKDPEED